MRRATYPGVWSRSILGRRKGPIMDARTIEGRIRRKAVQLLKLEDTLRAAKLAAPGNQRRHRPRSFQRAGMWSLEFRELLIREASYELWHKWWPSLPESHLRGAISKCSL